MLRGRNLPAHFFCLIDSWGRGGEPGRAGPVLAAGPVAWVEQPDQGGKSLRQTSGNSAGSGAKRIANAAASGTRAGSRARVPQLPATADARLDWREAIATTVSGLGYELVDVERAQRGLLRVYIDRLPGRGYPSRAPEGGVLDMGEFVTVDDCEQVTRQLQYVLEVEGLDYARLEVSSPGLDRPLRTEADFARFAGQAVSVTLKTPFQGRKVWQGVLGAAAEGDGWQLVLKDGKAEQVLGFRLEELREARLVPVVDFKGRRPAAQAADGGQSGAAPARAAASDNEGG